MHGTIRNTRWPPINTTTCAHACLSFAHRGFGGLLCEGRQQNLTISSGTQQTISPATLDPGSWDYYLLTLGSDFDYTRDTVGIAWAILNEEGVMEGKVMGSNRTNAFLSFDEGIYPRWVAGCGCCTMHVAHVSPWAGYELSTGGIAEVQ